MEPIRRSLQNIRNRKTRMDQGACSPENIFAVDYPLTECTGCSHTRTVCLVREFAAHRRLAANCKNPFFSRRKEQGIQKPYPPGHVYVCAGCTLSAHHRTQCIRAGKGRPTYTSRQRDDDFHYFAGTRGKTCLTSATSPSVSRISHHDNHELTDKQLYF
ncbi:uncharacterized protein LOC117236544 [Bombus vosnesenskii]|uniref:Uncharacterized protein LOC117236544 n=3 Tax=Pyrobombus TaxID=144703 RepID=A0A6J3KTQ3_9HYME|nr:uncharacterized protein LOC117152382 [Bombus impatiens]XP_033319917.1 uncharacterized protein LOC117216886 [Bombus bifarius]XP_033319918.1 uncharacterized protein LOC117216886 [Bombus bifarius]XP_033355495.1 uncharacterized protein LOC117236544 [Bombus vosnesenskii]XP_033355496.1 uncharacterized protein LOC117236544 [Bombus vosnesenskii]